MTAAAPLIATTLRRTAIFGVLFLPGFFLLVHLNGGFAPARSGDGVPRMPTVPVDPSTLASFQDTAAVGPGSGGRLDRDRAAVVGTSSVIYRAWTAHWKSCVPVPSKDPGTQLLRLDTARIVFFAEPETAPPAPAREDLKGTTTLAGDTAMLRQPVGARAKSGDVSARFEGNGEFLHRLGDSTARQPGETLRLRSEILEFTAEGNADPRRGRRILETDRVARIESGGAILTGTGMRAVLTGKDQVSLRIEHDADALFPVPDDPAAAIRVRCADPAVIETLDAAAGRSGSGRQLWRMTFRKDVVLTDPRGTVHADEITIECVRWGAADVKAGAQRTVVTRVVAVGSVRIEGTETGTAFDATCARLLSYLEDDRTEVTILEGPQRSSFRAAATSKDGKPRRFVLAGRGPTTIRERRAAAARTSASAVTFVAENDVVVTETAVDSDDLLAEVRAARVTIEARRSGASSGATRTTDPHLLRAEGGARMRREDLGLEATGKTVAWTAAVPGSPPTLERIAVVSDAVVRYRDTEGVNPFDDRGEAKPGIVELAATDRIDVTVGAAPAGSKARSGEHAVACRGGAAARKIVDGRATMLLTSKDIDAHWDPKAGLRDARAAGDARLLGESESGAGRGGELRGDEILLAAAPAAGRGALDAFVQGGAGGPALAILRNGVQRHEIRARELRSLHGNTLLVASGNASADLDYPEDAGAPGRSRRPPDARLSIDAGELRVELAPEGRGKDRLLRIAATGGADIHDATVHVLATDAVFDAPSGRVEARGNPARIVRVDDPKLPSHLIAPFVTASFDRAPRGGQQFLSGAAQQGGTFVAYHRPNGTLRERVTMTSKGPLRVFRQTADANDEVVVVLEKELPSGAWHMDARMDGARRVDVGLDTTGPAGAPSDRLRSLIATGASGDQQGVRVTARSPNGARAGVGIAERVSLSPDSTKIRLSCPSGGRVYVEETTERLRYTCDEVTVDYETYDWSAATRIQVLQE